jgi:putative transposase
MILPTRGEPVDTDRRAEIRKSLEPEEVERRIDKLLKFDQVRLSAIFCDEDIHRLCDELEIEFRERDLTPAITLGLFVSQVLSRGDACSTVMTQFNRERKRQGLSPCSEDGSAYCKARARLTVELIDRLGQCVVDLLSDKTRTQWKWKGRDVYLVDGLVLRAPDTAANQELYPQPSSQKEGLGYPQVRAVVTTSLATGCIVNYNTGPVEGKRTGETSLFREKHACFVVGDVIVGDSNFESFHDAALLNYQGVDIVCCINGSRNSPFEGVCKTIEDQIDTITKPAFNPARFKREEWNLLPESIQYRVIRYRVSGRNEVITIVTTLLDTRNYPSEDIAELYGLRWDVELDICALKSTMGMCDLRCRTPENLDREIAVGVLAYNLVRSLMNDAAAVLEIHPREVSFSRSRDAWRNFSDELKTPNDLMWIVLSATSRLVRDRPGRAEPRAIKRRNLTKYAKLKSPRPSRAKRIAAAASVPTVKPPENP